MYEIDGIPFLATSYAEANKLARASRKAVEDRLGKQGMMLLYTVAWPPQGIYSKKMINSAADMKGLKWRAYSPATAKIAELVNAQPVTIQAAELSQALATGVVDSYMSSGSTGYDTKTFEHLKFFADTQAWLPKNAVIMNKQAFDALDKVTQDAVLKSAAAAEPRGWKSSEEKTIWYVEELKKQGMTIYPPSAQLKADMKKVGETMIGDWAKKAGAEGQQVIDAYRKM
jgi:TRAP-type C4-dicarboxylate transport system substrate-binding protein